jgi:hypothetical protein
MAQPTPRQVHIDAAMTRISVAYRNSNYIAEQIFPVVPVQHQSDAYFVFDKASWFRNEAGVRAPGTRGPQVEYSVSSSTYACVPVAATKIVPDEVVDNADNPLAPRREATEFATDKVLLYLEEDVATNYVFGNNWTACGSNGTSSGSLYWSNDLSDPVGQINTAKEHIVGAIGREPNVMVMGRQVYTSIINHPDLLDKVKYTSVGLITMDLLPRLFQIPKVLVGNAIYTTSLEGAATTSYSFIWGKTVWLGYVPPSPGLMVPAAGYIFAWKNRVVERFRREEEKTDSIRCEMNYGVELTSPDAGFKLKTCVV